MTTRRKIAEQIQRIIARYKGDRENIEPILDPREAYEWINQSVNRVLAVETKQSFREGSIEIPTASIIKYTNQTVTSSSGTAYVDLPVFPIRLPLDMGVWEITNTGDPLNPFIPVPMEFAQLIQGTVVAGLEQKKGYYVESGKRVRFLTDVTSDSISGVDIRILVSDISTLADTDPLPLNADYEALVIQDVLQRFGLGQVGLTELQAQLNNGNTD